MDVSIASVALVAVCAWLLLSLIWMGVVIWLIKRDDW